MNNTSFPWRPGGARTRGIHVLAIIFCLLTFAGSLRFGMQLDTERERLAMMTALPCGSLAEPDAGPAVYTGRIGGPADRVTPSGRPAAIFHATVAWEEGSGKSKYTRTCTTGGVEKVTLNSRVSAELSTGTHALRGARVTESRDSLDTTQLRPDCAAALGEPGATYREEYFETNDLVTKSSGPVRWTNPFGCRAGAPR